MSPRGTVMRKRSGGSGRRVLAVALALIMANSTGAVPVTAQSAPQGAAIGHFIVIVQENRSFDNLYGLFPGANGLANAGDATTQLDLDGKPYAAFPQPLDNYGKLPPQITPDTRFPADLPNAPYLLSKYVGPNDKHGD